MQVKNNKLSPHFSYSEIFQRGKSGRITPLDTCKAQRLCDSILEPVREALGGRPISITSGKRSKRHNALVGGSITSEHLYRGQAAAVDFTCHDLPGAFQYIAEHCEYGQLIYYPARHFIHVSLKTHNHSGEQMMVDGGGRYLSVDKTRYARIVRGEFESAT